MEIGREMTYSIGLAGSTRAAEPTIDLAFFGDLRWLADTAEKDLRTRLSDSSSTRWTRASSSPPRNSSSAMRPLAVRLADGIKGSAAQLWGRQLAAACDRLEESA